MSTAASMAAWMEYLTVDLMVVWKVLQMVHWMVSMMAQLMAGVKVELMDG